jgi:hypothetical protein
MRKDLTPLEVCERLIGPLEQLGRITGNTDKALYIWRRESKFHGPGDIRSARHMRAILAHSDRLGLGLTPLHLIEGASLQEVEEILAGRHQLRPTG